MAGQKAGFKVSSVESLGIEDRVGGEAHTSSLLQLEMGLERL